MAAEPQTDPADGLAPFAPLDGPPTPDPLDVGAAAKREASLPGLLDALEAFARRYVAMAPAQAAAVALWIAHTHAADAAEATPYLSIESAEKRSGKTRLLEVVELLVSGPLPAANATIAAIFRSIATPPTTLLMDEVDAVFGPKANANHEDLRALLNSGYRPGMPALRCVGEGSKQRPEAFAVFCPKALAGIGALPDTLADRSIPIRLKRQRPEERVKRFRRREARAAADPLRERLVAFGEQHVDALAEARPELPDELDDRAQDGWEPLLAIADLAGDEWPERARAAALELSGEKAAEDDSIGVRLLADIRRAFDSGLLGDRVSSASLIEELASDEEAPWARWRGDGKITPRALAGILRRYDIRSATVRIGEATAKGYRREQFEDSWRRYLAADPPDSPSHPQHPAHRSSHAGSSADPMGNTASDVTDAKEAANPHERTGVTDVAATGPDQGAGAPDGEDDAWLATASMDELRARYGAEVEEPDSDGLARLEGSA